MAPEVSVEAILRRYAGPISLGGKDIIGWKFLIFWKKHGIVTIKT